jgi:hypothetical protein
LEKALLCALLQASCGTPTNRGVCTDCLSTTVKLKQPTRIKPNLRDRFQICPYALQPNHSHISVLLQNYMHGFGVIHQFLMSKM